MIDTTPSRGKIGALPVRLREQINQRLLNGRVDTEILPWLNALPEVQKRLGERFDGVPISPANLSNWRTGPYQLWLSEQKEIEATQRLAELSESLVDASGVRLTAGAKAIATGRVMARLSQMGDDTDLEALLSMVQAVHKLHASDVADAKLTLDQDKAAQDARRLELDEQKFKYAVADKLLTLSGDARVKEIEALDASKEVKMDLLIDHIWGPRPNLAAASSRESGG
jgi:hypothetical protein